MLLSLSLTALVACSQEESTNEVTESQKIIIGSHGSDADIWQFIAQSPEAKKPTSILMSKLLMME